MYVFLKANDLISNRKNIVHEESFETPGSVGAKLNEETLNTGPYRNFRNGKYNVHEELREEAIKTTPQLYNWCEKNNIEFKILSKTNPADSRIKRLKTIKDI